MHFLSWLLDFYQRLTGSHVAYNQCVCRIREVHSQYSRLSGPSINKSLKSPLPNICSCVRARTESQTSARTWQALAYCHPPTTASTKLPSPTLLHTPGIFAAPQRSQAQSPLGCGSFLCLCGKGTSVYIFPSYFLTSVKSVQVVSSQVFLDALNKIVPYSYITLSFHPLLRALMSHRILHCLLSQNKLMKAKPCLTDFCT